MKLLDLALGILVGYALVRRKPSRLPSVPAHLLN